MTEPTTPITVRADGVELSGEVAGDGPPVLLLHGLTATRRYVVHGSRVIERAGQRVVAFDARGHGRSSPAPRYAYDALVADAVSVLDALGIARATVCGQSMGAATAAGLALRHPERVAALCLVTPAHLGRPSHALERWDALAEGLETGGPDGFLAALRPLPVPERWRDPIETVIRQRLERHADLLAVARALREIPRTAAFDGLDALSRIAAPTLVVGSQDEIDWDHPLSTAREYAARIPAAELVVEAPGESPLAWRGGALSQAILSHMERSGV